MLKSKYIQSQKTNSTLSTNLIQGIKILELNHNELCDLVKRELTNNPILQVKDSFYHQAPPNISETIAVPSLSYTEELLLQWHSKNLPHEIEAVGDWFIKHIDKHGYMVGDLENLSQRTKISRKRLTDILSLVQQLEPAGIGSRNIIERFLIQAKHLNITDTNFLNLLRHDFILLQNRKFNLIKKKYNLSKENILGHLSRLNKLSSSLSFENPLPSKQYLEPDLTLSLTPNSFEIRIPENREIPIYISEYYLALLQNTALDDETHQYIVNHINKARWLIKNIETRKNNLVNVAKYIIQSQINYFEDNQGKLMPLLQQDVASYLSISNSTVSRLVNNKYISTPRGTLELKTFFSHRVCCSNNLSCSVSADYIKNLIKEIISNENKTAPLSDEKIKSHLEKSNIYISRRTITKYRRSLGISCAPERKTS